MSYLYQALKMVANITNLRLHVPAYLERAGDGNTVRVLKISADGEAGGDA